MTATALDPQIGLEPNEDQQEIPDNTHHTNVYVGIEFDGTYTSRCFGPFRSKDEARLWCESNVVDGYVIREIIRPVGVEDVAFYLTANPPVERMTKDGMDAGQTQIGDYIDPTVVP